jgi:O-antigen ligase
MFKDTSEIFEFNKMIFIYIITVLITGTWAIKMILQEKHSFPRSAFFITVGVFLLTQILSTIFSIDQHTSIFGYYGRFNGGLLSIIAYLLLFFVFLCEYTPEFLQKLLIVSTVSSLFVMLWGLPGKIGHDLTCGIFTGSFTNSCWTAQFRPDERLFSTLGQPNWLGAYLAIHFFIGIYFFIKYSLEKLVTLKYLFVGYTVLNFIVILFTRSRSALGAVGIGFAGLLIFAATNKKLQNTMFKELPILIVLFIAAIVFFKTGVDKIDRFITLPTTVHVAKPPSEQQQTQVNNNVTDSVDIRKIVWKGAWELTKQYPLFGTGVETFAYSYYFTRPVEHNNTSEWDFLYNKAHNEFLNYFATTGFLGGGAYILMIAMVCYLFLKKIILLSKKEEITHEFFLTVCLLLAYISILITNFWGFSTTTVSLFFYIIPAYVVFNNVPQNLNKAKQKTVMLDDNIMVIIRSGIVCFSIIGMSVGLIYFGRYWVADVQYSQADAKYRIGSYSQAALDIVQILKYHHEHVYEDKAALAIAGAAINAPDKETTNDLILLSTYYNKKAISESPMNVLYYKTTGAINYNFYQATTDQKYLAAGLAAYKQAFELAPTDPRMPHTIALYALELYSLEKDTAKKEAYRKLASENIDKAIKLKPDYADAYVLKANYYKKTGQKDKAINTYKYLLKTFDSNNQDFKKQIEDLQNGD